MALRIAHISDTHIGKRPRQTRPGIINQEIRPLEDDYYSAWMKFVNEAVDANGGNRPDIILQVMILALPPEYARKVAAMSFKQLNDAKIPLVIIDGNHGRYVEYRSSTLSVYPIVFDNVHLFTHYGARDSLRTEKPLFKDFSDLNLSHGPSID
jgi:DNA repair exonuclease SbcCD nuclease subunit